MKTAKEFRAAARAALSGKWGIAVLAGFIASLLGGVGMSSGNSFNVNVSDEDIAALKNMDSETQSIFIGLVVFILSFAFVIGIVLFFIGSIIELGYNKFNLNLVDGNEVRIGQLVSYFSHWKKAISVSFLRWLYTFLWSLLFIIPGIIAAYSYSMATYITSEYPDISAKEALRLSKVMMYGNKWRLFCLFLSFIGWSILCGFTFGIGYLWLIPYEKAAITDFYREVSGTVVLPDENISEAAPEAAEA